MIQPKIIAVDFDGTCVTHEFPEVGREIGAVPVLHELLAAGHQLILWTMRSDDPVKNRMVLQDAVEWGEKHGLVWLGHNSNPGQSGWTSSPKAYAHLYIDDAALGAPLKHDPAISARPFIDWDATREMLVKHGYLS